MLGWNIAVYRQSENNTSPATSESPASKRLAIWQTGLGGLEWIDELVKKNEAIDLGGNGYPNKYTAKAKTLIPYISDKPPLAKEVWSSDEGDVLLDTWVGKTVIDRNEIKDCSPDEWLIIEAFDES